MADDGPSPEREPRRGSLGRAFDRVRAVMQRRSMAVRAAQAQAQTPRTAPVSQDGQSVVVRVAEHANISRPTSSEIQRSAEPVQPAQAIFVETNRGDSIPAGTCPPVDAPNVSEQVLNSLAVDSAVEVDSAEEDNFDIDEALLPMQTSRSGLGEERARRMFAQHGLTYQSRYSRQQQPPNKIRRVEKPIRLRIHWTCHQCNTQFGLDRTCVECGHLRCGDCTSQPPKRIRDLSDHTRTSLEEERRPESLPVQSVEALSSITVPIEQPPTAPAANPVQAVELGQDGEYELDAVSSRYELSIYARPRAAVQTVWKTQRSLTSRPAKHTQDSEDEEEVPVFKAVQRVYRKPRQRVRYTCEHCGTLFTGGARCIQCSHERCNTCQREPPKNQSTHFHDAELLRAVSARLGGYGGGFGQAPEITASAG